MRRAGVRVVIVGAALWVGAAAAAVSNGRPTIGRHDGELCVATGTNPPSCGPAQVELRRNGSARVRIDDIVYLLQLRSIRVEVVLMHGAMQIDEFVAPYDWVGSTLQFIDGDRSTRYEVRFNKRVANEPVR